MIERISKMVGRRKGNTSPIEVPQEKQERPINPVAEPDLARMLAIGNTPGVLTGTLESENEQGKYVTDFDKREKYYIKK